MIELVLRTEAFYFSYSYDITHTLQRLQLSPTEFYTTSFIERADQRFVWNRYLLAPFMTNKLATQFALPIIHGCKLLINPIIVCFLFRCLYFILVIVWL